jgi:hypothetical protein
MSNTFDAERFEQRIPITIAVHISGHGRTLGVETTFTENVSSRGARVSSIRKWQTNEKVEIESLPGNFHALARVTYCRAQSEGFVIGLEFLEPSGQWVVDFPVGAGKPLQG